MKETIKRKVQTALKDIYGKEFEVLNKASFEPPKRKEFGDVATNIAFLLAKELKKAPKDIAQEIAAKLSENPEFEKVEVAGSGFINLFLSKEFYIELLKKIVNTEFYLSDIGKGEKILLEYVSANPTGPLHVGHGRGAVVGDVLSKIMEIAGYKVEREFYINDAGRQIKLLGISVYYRMQELAGRKLTLPEDAYRGEYIVEIAKELMLAHPELIDMEEDKAIEIIANYAKETLLKEIKETLSKLKVEFDRWYSEKSLYSSGKVDEVLRKLQDKGLVYEKDGALWLKTSLFGDDKDRVVKRSNGEYTYFASDIAYHYDKIERGYDKGIDIWGADHHGYIPRVKAAIEALGQSADWLEVILVQLVKLFKHGKEVKMSKRAGNFVTLDWLIEEVGVDAVRFFFLTKRHDTPLDFDIDLAVSEKSENPVYYVQYAHARISSILDKASEAGLSPSEDHLGLIKDDEFDLIIKCYGLKTTLENAAVKREPHLLPYYLIDLASSFHKYYNKNRVIDNDNPELSSARLYIVKAVKRVIKIGLDILNVNAPRRM
ncbi:arginine--tRNA ligase [Desulfurobacterium atlanticum]|uniref:Arginine--tRNA ligase n=1 Tax=Desulfurobacterium atlanticum TaxID=240169 RepID=A0A239A2L7_9BACT|nr:arginine--tRNA ligase [Desulfurobacterium atlanticum]SNR89143.1 arginyl-tRNA synthetase [Desulfurobacterium atlanticum]